MATSSHQKTPAAEPSRWRENHGNFLLGVIGIILIAGSAVLAYRQTRFHAPRFPHHVRHAETEESLLLAQANALGQGELQVIVVRVIGAASDIGLMNLAVYTSEEGFNDPSQALGVDRWRIVGGICEGRFALPAEIEELAIAAYHDENNNGILDRNALGIPSERYGFTGDARGLAGPPEYSEAVVPITSEPIQISIR